MICLEGLSDEELLGRILGGRRTSLATGEVYHLEHDSPPRPEERLDPGPFLERDDDTEEATRAPLEAWRREADALKAHYESKGLLAVVDAVRSSPSRPAGQQASRQQQAGQDLARESVEAYAEFQNTAFAQYRAGTERAAEGARNLAATTTSAVGTAAGATTGAVSEATDTAAAATRSAAETATFPIPGYDGMNVEEISGQLGSLTDDQIRQLRDYERENQNRKTLMEGYEAKLRASS